MHYQFETTECDSPHWLWESFNELLKESDYFWEQECIPVGCIPSPAVAVSPAMHAPLAMHAPTMHAPANMPPTMHTPPWTEGMIHPYENITFPQLLLRRVKMMHTRPTLVRLSLFEELTETGDLNTILTTIPTFVSLYLLCFGWV